MPPIVEEPAFVVDNPYFVEHTFVDLDHHKIVVVVRIISIIVNTAVSSVSSNYRSVLDQSLVD